MTISFILSYRKNFSKRKPFNAMIPDSLDLEKVDCVRKQKYIKEAYT
ncbi:4709_t:CDS:1, partial [Dentiscutata heterogama]